MVTDYYSGTFTNFLLIAAAELLRSVVMMYGRDVEGYKTLLSGMI